MEAYSSEGQIQITATLSTSLDRDLKKEMKREKWPRMKMSTCLSAMFISSINFWGQGAVVDPSLVCTHVGVKVVAAGDEEGGAAVVEDDGVAAKERRVRYLGDEGALIRQRDRFEHLRRGGEVTCHKKKTSRSMKSENHSSLRRKNFGK